MMLFEKAFWSQIDEFVDLQQQKNDNPDNPFHRRVDKHMGSKSQKMKADRYALRYTGEGEKTYSGELNNKIELIRNGTSDLQVLSDVDCDHILKNYPIDELPRDKPKKLSNSGMMVKYNPEIAKYILIKDE